jgi:hypothetical protein
VSRVLLSVVLTLVIIYVVPFLVYSVFHAVGGLKVPEGVPAWRLLLSFLVSKVGTSIAFVLIFYFARGSLGGQWLLYAFIWWIMFVIGEVGQAVGPNYSWNEAIAGMITETIYLPAAAFVTSWLIGVK